MNVCLVTTVFPRWQGDGEGVFVWRTAKMLARHGVSVRVVAMHSPETKPVEVWDGVEIVRPLYWWPVRRELLRKDGGGLPVTFRKYLAAKPQLASFFCMHALTAARLATGCDLIHAQFTLSSAAARLGRVWHGRPIVTTVHGSDIYQIPQLPGGRWFTRWSLDGVERVIAVSQNLADTAVSFGVSKDKIRVISNSVDTDLFQPPGSEREPFLLFVGSLIRRKGLTYLLDALPTILRAHPEYRLVIVGDGPELPSLRSQVVHRGIANSVIFVGRGAAETVREWMQRARLFILPSLEEGQGVVLLEALASGLPVVATNVGGIPDVVDSQVGRLVTAGDSQALATAVEELLSNLGKWQELAFAARRRAETRFSEARIVRQLLQVYQEVLAHSFG